MREEFHPIMNRIRLGLIGYGLRGRGLLPVARAMEDTYEVTAVCAGSERTGEALHREHPEIAYFTDLPAMLDSGGIEAVVVETPPDTHTSCTVTALERNLHVLCDVPAVHGIDEAQSIWEAAAASDGVYMLGATTNYWGMIDTCLELQADGVLGTPVHLEAEYIQDIRGLAERTPWRRGYEPMRYCTHSLGPLLRWSHEELISACCMDTGSRILQDAGEHDAMVALFQTASGTVVRTTISFVNCHPHPHHRFVYHGTEGYYECTWPAPSFGPAAFYSRGPAQESGGSTPIQVSDRRAGLTADQAMLADFAAAVRGGPVVHGVRDALAMTLPGLFALESARRSGERIAITYPWS